MFKELRKIWIDITTNCATGKYGMKRLQVFLATVMSVAFSMPYIIELHIWPEQSLNFIQPPNWLIYAWLAIGFGFAGLNEWGKQQAIKNSNGEPIKDEEENG